jgi:hypothetical protein
VNSLAIPGAFTGRVVFHNSAEAKLCRTNIMEGMTT